VPYYTFRKRGLKKEFVLELSMAGREDYLKEHPEMEQVMTSVAIAAPMNLGIKGVKNKPDASFRDLLKTMKKKHRGSTINNF
jgi:hypothetical protein